LADKVLIDHIETRITHGAYTGVIVGLIDGGKVTIQSFGEVEKGSGRKPDADTIYEIGSITKTMTATILADMALKGELNLDDPVQKFLPDSISLAAKDGRLITLEDIATHYSGLPRVPPDLEPVNPLIPFAGYNLSMMWRDVDNFKPTRTAGETQEYSNFAYGVLGQILVQQSGLNYRELIGKVITSPLAMESTDTVLTPKLAKRAAIGYWADGKPTPYTNTGSLVAAGGIRSSLNDMLIYIRAQMGLLETDLQQAIKETHKNRYESIGLGWFSILEGRGFSHNGGTNGFRSFAGFLKDGSKGVVVLSNSFVDVDEIGIRLLNMDAALPEINREMPLTTEELAQYQGEYTLSDDETIAISLDDGKLVATQSGGYPSIQLFHKGNGEFFWKGMDGEVSFEWDGDRAVAMLDSELRLPRVTYPSDAFSEWAKEHAYPMKTLDAGQGVEDLEGLRAIVGDARVVALGESNHWIGEITQAKHRIAEFLIKEMGFNAIAIEAGFADSLILDEYVQGGKETTEMWYRGGSLGMTMYPEMQAIVEWMRAYNQDPGHTRKLHFYGTDFLGGIGTWMPAIDRLIAYFETVEPAYAKEIRQTLLPLVEKFERPLASVKDFSDDKEHPIFSAQAAYDALPQEERFACTASISKIIDRLDLLEYVYKEKTSASDFEMARQLAVALRQADRYKMNRNAGRFSPEFWASNDGAATFGIRSRTMAENTIWLQERYGKVILMLHNNHLRKTTDSEQTYNTGHYLQHALKDDYVTIGCTYGFGPWYMDADGKVIPEVNEMPKPGSLDAGMLNTGLPMFYLNLREVPKSGPVYDWLTQPRPSQVTGVYFDYPNTLEIWDGLYFVREIQVTGRQH